MKHVRFYKCMAVAIVAMLMLSLVSCTADPEKMVQATNALYLDIKTVVTDPAVKDQIPPGTMDRLAGLEQQYLAAANNLKEAGAENAKPLGRIVTCADGVMDIVESLMLDTRHQSTIAAIRLSLNILKNHIQLE